MKGYDVIFIRSTGQVLSIRPINTDWLNVNVEPELVEYDNVYMGKKIDQYIDEKSIIIFAKAMKPNLKSKERLLEYAHSLGMNELNFYFKIEKYEDELVLLKWIPEDMISHEIVVYSEELINDKFIEYKDILTYFFMNKLQNNGANKLNYVLKNDDIEGYEFIERSKMNKDQFDKEVKEMALKEEAIYEQVAEILGASYPAYTSTDKFHRPFIGMKNMKPTELDPFVRYMNSMYDNFDDVNYHQIAKLNIEEEKLIYFTDINVKDFNVEYQDIKKLMYLTLDHD